MSKSVHGVNPSNNIENTSKSVNFDSRDIKRQETFKEKPTWNKSYTLVLLLNALYIVLFFIIMKTFS